MSFKKRLETKKAQAVVEYVVLFLVIVLGLAVVFWTDVNTAFNPDSVSIKGAFTRAINSAITQINK